MFAKGKGQQMPSDIQAKEKLAHYVYEYLMHLGAKQSAQTFLQEIRWDKNVSLGEAPGFLSSWWCVFWDLYCAAPERRGQYEASEEAKIFHDYQSVNAPAPGTNPMMIPGQPQFARFHPSQRGMKMPANVDYNTVNNQSSNTNPSGTSSVPSNNSNPTMNIDAARVTSSMSPMSRLTPPGGRAMSTNQQTNPQQPQNINNLNFNGPPQGSSQQIRGPNNQPSMTNTNNNAPMSPMPNMNMQQQQHAARWSNSNQNSNGPPNQSQAQLPPPQSTMSYSSSSPAPYGANPQQINPHGPGTPIVPSPSQEGGDMNYSLNKIVPSSMQYHDQNMSNIVPMNSEMTHHSQINGEIMDSLKNSPITNLASGNRHHEEPIADLNPYNNFADTNLF